MIRQALYKIVKWWERRKAMRYALLTFRMSGENKHTKEGWRHLSHRLLEENVRLRQRLYMMGEKDAWLPEYTEKLP